MTGLEVEEIYADGGCIQRNPSPIGGTWAWCGVNHLGERVMANGGFYLGPAVTNNHMEQLAIVLALEAMHNGWSGRVFSDSQVALGRVFEGWRTKNLPAELVVRTRDVLMRMGTLSYMLLQGHPTRADLAAGVGKKRGFPVSQYNVWCDQECGRQAKSVLAMSASVVST